MAIFPVLWCGIHHRGNLQAAMADRVVFQMDQAESQDQKLPRHLGKCGHDANLGRNDSLSARRIYQVPQPRRHLFD